MKLLLNPEYNLYEKDGQAFCDSLQIAGELSKRHDHVMRDIEKKLVDISQSGAPKFGETNFIKSDYRDSQNKKQPRYLLTKDGFVFLVTAYGGTKATNFKIAYINRFNDMEAFIQSLATTRIEFPAFTEAIMLTHDEPKHYHFSNEINMIYRIVLGSDAKDFREQHGLEKGIVIKPFLTLEQIQAIESLQRIDIGLLEAELDYDQRKERLTNRYHKMLLRLSA